MKRKSYFSAEIKGNPLRCPSRNRSGKHRRVSYVSPFYQHVFVLLHPYDCADFLALSGSDSAAQGNFRTTPRASSTRRDTPTLRLWRRGRTRWSCETTTLSRSQPRKPRRQDDRRDAVS